MRLDRCWLVLPVFVLLQFNLQAAAGQDSEPVQAQTVAHKGHNDHKDYKEPHTSYPGECEPGFGFTPFPLDREGYYDEHPKGTCEPCDPGFYAPGGYAPCRPCGDPNDGFTTPLGAYKPDQCYCLPGFGGVGCTTCPVGTWSTGGTKDEPRAACTLCNNGALSKEGSTSERACGCPPGRGGQACSICPTGTYGPGGVDPDFHPLECQDCPSRQTTLYPGAHSPDQCVCQTGFAGPFCNECSNSQICPGGDKEEPTRCPANSVSPLGGGVFSVRDCLCQPGYGRPAHSLSTAECKDCPLCELCPPGTYNNNGTDSCKPCLPGYTSVPGSTEIDACTACLEGEFEADGLCIKCPIGTTTSGTGQGQGRAACNLCIPGYSPLPCPGTKDGSCTSCQPCPAGTFGLGGVEACVPCDAGQTSPPGSFSNETCTACSVLEYEEDNKCFKCPLGSFSGTGARGQSSCSSCNNGYGFLPCPGTKDSSCLSCQPCPTGTFSTNGFNAVCVPCGAGKTSPPGSDSSENCTKCTADEYEEDNKCFRCPLGSFSVNRGRGQSACNSCNNGYGFLPCPGTKDSSCLSCQPCPTGTFSTNGFNAVCVPCDAGKTSPPGSDSSENCTNCTAFEYEEGGICSKCPIGSIAGDGSGRGKDACRLCLPGFGVQPCPGSKGGSCTSCQPCPVGSYQGGFGEFGCRLCPDGATTTNSGATGSGNCVCKSGFGVDADAKVKICKMCPVGFYSSPATENSCFECPTGMTTLQPGSTSQTDCVCKVGFGRSTAVPFNFQCQECAPPLYQGYLDANFNPVTSATRENPFPPCLRCSTGMTGTTANYVVGGVDKICQTQNTGTGIGAYCVNTLNPTGGTGTPVQRGCTFA